jgi:hypothetical protein
MNFELLLKCIWKKKLSIIISTFLSAAIAASIALFMVTKEYEISALIQPYQAQILTRDEYQQIRQIDISIVNSVSLVSAIQSGVYDQKILSQLGIPENKQLEIRTVQQKNTELLLIKILWPSPKKGKQIVELLIEHIQQSFDLKLQELLGQLDAQYSANKMLTESLNIQQKLLRDKIDLLNEKIEDADAIQTDFNQKLQTELFNLSKQNNTVDLYLLSTLLNSNLLNAQGPMFQSVVELETQFAENEIQKANSMIAYESIVTAKKNLQVLQVIGGVQASVSPVTMGLLKITVLGSVIGLTLTLLIVVILCPDAIKRKI